MGEDHLRVARLSHDICVNLLDVGGIRGGGLSAGAAMFREKRYVYSKGKIG